jgi:hypothetical protein
MPNLSLLSNVIYQKKPDLMFWIEMDSPASSAVQWLVRIIPMTLAEKRGFKLGILSISRKVDQTNRTTFAPFVQYVMKERRTLR